MTHVSKKGLSLALAMSLGSLSLVGCGASPLQRLGGTQPAPAHAASVVLSPEQMAQAFAAELKATTGVVPGVQGSVVTLKAADGSLVTYDFAQTPRTGKVVFRAGDVTSTIAYAGQAGPAMVPWSLIFTAVKMVWGGAKAWWWYDHTHQGPDFNRDDLVKAILYGVCNEAVGSLPLGFLWQRMFPIVWKWVTGEDPIRPDSVATRFERLKSDAPAIAQILQEGYQLQHAGRLE